ncbi:MAG TPA: uracil-DNA glycosylase, partial [Thermoplasmatales archaeon]|nr:uracil-DNA glycosylase [Thermoplasmatales archaeon]
MDDKWSILEQQIGDCRRCNLWKTRNNPVVGDGSTDARAMFIGEAPGYW